MDCERCNGRMMPDRYVDHRDDEEPVRELPWRCVNCGNVVDAGILQNRAAQAVPAAAAV